MSLVENLRALEAVYETKRESINNNDDLDEATKKKQLSDLDIQFNTDKEYYLIKGGDVSDFFKLGSQGELIKAANRAAKKQIKARRYWSRLAKLFNKISRVTSSIPSNHDSTIW